MNPAFKHIVSFRCVALLCAIAFCISASAQNNDSYADSTRMKALKNGAGHELTLENSTKAILGFLYNYSNGKTRFKIGIDSIWSAGTDTIKWRYTDGTVAYKLVTEGSGGGGITVDQCYRDVLIDSSNFINDTTFTDSTLAGTIIYAIFANDAPAFIYEGIDYNLVDSGATITLPDFTATTEQYRFHVYAIDTSGTCANAVTITEGGGGGSTDTTNLSARIDHLALYHTLQTITYSSTITMDANDGYNGKVTLTGDATFDISNMASGESGWILVTQDATGGRSLTFPAGTKIALGYGGSQVPDLSTAGGKTDLISVIKNGSALYITSVIRDFQ